MTDPTSKELKEFHALRAHLRGWMRMHTHVKKEAVAAALSSVLAWWIADQSETEEHMNEGIALVVERFPELVRIQFADKQGRKH